MVLSDRDITQRLRDGDLTITPIQSEHIEPASVDLHLGDDFKLVQMHKHKKPISLDGDFSLDYDSYSDRIVLKPGEFVLGTTREVVDMPDDLAANVLGRSSLGRLGISVHQTAGFIDPGFKGEITLELTNHGPAPVELSEGDRVCQIVFHELSSEAERPYGHSGSQYQNQSGATPSGMRFD